MARIPKELTTFRQKPAPNTAPDSLLGRELFGYDSALFGFFGVFPSKHRAIPEQIPKNPEESHRFYDMFCTEISGFGIFNPDSYENAEVLMKFKRFKKKSLDICSSSWHQAFIKVAPRFHQSSITHPSLIPLLGLVRIEG